MTGRFIKSADISRITARRWRPHVDATLVTACCQDRADARLRSFNGHGSRGYSRRMGPVRSDWAHSSCTLLVGLLALL
jgi:hypothetical protein